jgi:hypothetical protein
MSDSPCRLFARPPCTACDPAVPATPLSLVNPPGQPALRYRIGDFVVFRQAMLDALTARPVSSGNPADPSRPAVLTSRAADDYAIALLDLWAYVGDVLTFYQQAIANEAFLRTAVLRESLARLAALIGYEPFRGVAASVWLAFFADKGAVVELPAGFQTQSVPPPRALPATFETASSLSVRDTLNQLTLLGPPSAATFGASGELIGDPGQPPVVEGAKLFFYPAAPVVLPLVVSEQVVTKVSPSSLGKKIQWRSSPGVAASSTVVSRVGRKFKHFGATAPAEYLWPTSATQFTITQSHFEVASSNTILLDAVYDGLPVGGRILVLCDSAYIRVATIAAVTQMPASVGPVSGTCTQVTVSGDAFPAFVDLRLLTMYELLGDDLPFRHETNSDVLPAGTDTIYVADATGVTKGTQILLVENANADMVTVRQDPVPVAGQPGAVLLTRALSATYTTATTRAYANVLRATHGETQTTQILGDGDASKAWQEFPLSVAPVTAVPDSAAERGARSTLRVFVDNIEWTEVPSFYGCAGDAAVFVTRVDETGTLYVRFGDGTTGRRLPTGSRNVQATLRKGLGAAGNVEAGTVSTLLQTLPGIKAVTNPLAGAGGEEAEPPATLRENAPSTVITLDRAVSLRDYEALALSYPIVAKATAAWADFGSRRGVALTVAAAAGQSLPQIQPDLRLYLDRRRDPNVPLSIQGATPVYLAFEALVHVLANHKQSVVKAACEAALGPALPGGYLSFDRLRFGQSIFQSALLAVVQQADGVDWVELRRFSIWPSAAGHGVGAVPDRLDAVLIGSGEIAAAVLDDSTHTPGVRLQYQGGVNDLEVT